MLNCPTSVKDKRDTPKPIAMLDSVRGNLLMKLGIVLTAIGMCCTLIAIIPLFWQDVHLGSYWWGLSMLSGLGLALILLGLRRSAGTRRRLK